MSEEDINVSDGEEEQELSKEERLEAARKKFEELKKKKKKGKKKSKKESGSVEPEDQEDSEKKDTEEPEELAETETEKKELVTEESKKEEATVAVPEVPTDDAEVSPKSVAEAPVSEPVKSTASEQKATIIESAKGETTKPAVASEDSSTIQQLNETIEQQKNTIKKLRDENTDLKLSKMDLLDRISELELLTEQLKKSGGISNVQVPSKVVPAEPVFKKNDFASESTQNLAVSATEDFREKLMVWKGWQADMTNWGGVQTQIVKL
ncbi:hypothetical protein CLIB1423_02S04060 [[Candida] railenensis]|uniref:Uncharacterized protein n=1 Tax=[Candida] railenensis TaxID=45579 RepID=A0A9P0QLQ5_9ASCO|nr:hypothetical protein CLIB1423_02S04060 [[Candida] railenensis]